MSDAKQFSIGGQTVALKDEVARTSKLDKADVAPSETSPATSEHVVGEILFYNGRLYKVTAAISVGDTLVENTNIEATTLGEVMQEGGGGTVIVPVPTANETSFTYNGTVQGITFNGLDTSKVIITNGTATDAGSYTATVQLKNSNMIWSDTTTTPKTFNWSIGQATPTLSASPSSMTFDKTSSSAVGLTITTDSDATPALSGYDTDIVTVSGSGTAYTVTPTQKTGSTSITISLAATTNYTAASTTVSITAKFVTIYGVEWDGTSTTKLSRTDASESFVDPSPAVNNGTGSSPFDNCAPWKDIKRQTSANSGEVVYIPKFWVKITKTGSKLKIQIADGEVEGFVPAPAFQDAGDGRGELDYILVGRYHCASDFKSKTGVKPHANITRAAFRTGIHNLGTDVYQWDYAVRLTLFYLYLVEFADWNSQATIGYGCGNNSGTQNMGATDAMQYHTGTAAANRTTYGVGVQYRYIEGLWDNVYDFVDGIYFSGADVYIVKNPENFSDTSNGTKIGTRPTTGNYISAFFVGTGEYAAFIYPSEVAGSESTYVCDFCGYSASGVVLFAGGYYSQGQDNGLFFLSGNSTASSAVANIGSRLLEKPSAA